MVGRAYRQQQRPYVLDEYVANNYAVLKRNPHYYGQAAKEPVVRVNFITSIPP
ncbi:hypothetical protein AHiyo8_51090 [Arthrobacter sp. Hiyo8]|nr:hypothetical protein AHiyo8_51090 [Arthrobacter sp. Hiyo8]